MAKKTRSFVFLIFLMVIVGAACQTKSNTSSEGIVGTWAGEAQWMCGHGDPAWATKVEFKADGTFNATMNIPNLPQSVGNGDWRLSENNIEIKFSKDIWTGTVSSNKMEGTFKDDSDSCTGVWSLTEQ